MDAFLRDDRTRVMGPVELGGRLAALEDALRERPHHIMQTRGGEPSDNGPVFTFNIDGEMQIVLEEFVRPAYVDLATALGNLLRRERYMVLGRFFLGLQGNGTPNEDDCVAEGRKNEGDQTYVLYHNFFAHQAVEGNLGFNFPAFFDNDEELRAKLSKVTDKCDCTLSDVRRLARVVYVISRRGPDCLTRAHHRNELYHAILQAAEHGMMAGGFCRRREDWSWVYPRYPLLLAPMRFAAALPSLPGGAALASSGSTISIYGTVAQGHERVEVLDLSGRTPQRVLNSTDAQSTVRARASACMVDGCVYVTGGENTFDTKQQLRQSWNTLHRVSLQDGTWQWMQGMDHRAQVTIKSRPLPHLKYGGHYRHAHTSIAHDGYLYVISGFIWAKGANGQPSEVLRSDVMRYNTRARDGWVCMSDVRRGDCTADHRGDRAEKRDWSVRRAACSAVVIDGVAYIIGGYSRGDRSECSAAVLALDLVTGAVTEVLVEGGKDMDLDRVGAGACAHGSSIFLVGGTVHRAGGTLALKSALRLDVSAKGARMTAVALPDMPAPRPECHVMMVEPLGTTRPALVVLSPERACVMDAAAGVWGQARGDQVFFHDAMDETM